MKKRDIAVGAALLRIRPAPVASALKRLLRVRRHEHQTAEGVFWLDPASYLGATLLRNNVYEPALLETLKNRLRLGDTFVDVGANEGYFSVIAARAVGAHGRVIAIEPQARVQPILRRNIELNNCRNVTLVQAAVSDCCGTAELHLTPDMNNSASSLTQPTRYALRRETVPQLTLERIWEQAGITQCTLMKVDIEGWEYEAVLGSRSLFLQGKIEALALELHPHLLTPRGRDASEITNFLASCGYRQIPGMAHALFVRS